VAEKLRLVAVVGCGDGRRWAEELKLEGEGVIRSGLSTPHPFSSLLFNRLPLLSVLRSTPIYIHV
jgi:hypothetical protein